METISVVRLMDRAPCRACLLEGALRDPTRFARKCSILRYSLRSRGSYPTYSLQFGNFTFKKKTDLMPAIVMSKYRWYQYLVSIP